MSADELMCAVRDKKAVTWATVRGVHKMPAAFVVNMQFRMVMNMLPAMHVYRPTKVGAK